MPRGEQGATRAHVYLRGRTYNPAVGRFLQQDRVMGALMQPATLHRYAYAFNNPVSVVDPTGRMPALNRSVNPANAGGAQARAERILYEDGFGTIGISNTESPCSVCEPLFKSLAPNVELVYPLPLRKR